MSRPFPDDDDAVGDELHLAHEVAGDEDGAALVGEAAEQRADPPHPVEVEAVDRLVEEQHPRVADRAPPRCRAAASCPASRS